ncbi:MAG: hypothetical protein KatS3mg051_0954 [Anaerolineae bacterium]|nr:MAG: hypothetical protein KatS3mg051_0954 [Anaerolineae bacterium]
MDRNPDDRNAETFETDPPGAPGPEEELLRSIVATAATIRHGGQVSPNYRGGDGQRQLLPHRDGRAPLLGASLAQYVAVQRFRPDSVYRRARGQPLATGGGEHQPRGAFGRSPWRGSWPACCSTCTASGRTIPAPSLTTGTVRRWTIACRAVRVTRCAPLWGGIQRAQFSRIQALLRLPDSVWELADRYRLEEKRLRYVLKVDDEALQVQLGAPDRDAQSFRRAGASTGRVGATARHPAGSRAAH